MTDSSDMNDEATAVGSAAARQALLNVALAAALEPPVTPSDLAAGVWAAIAREPVIDWQARRQVLQAEHRAAIAALNRRYLRRCRDAVLVGTCLLAVLGSSIEPLAAGLAPFFANAAPMVAGFMALGLGVFCGAALLQDLFKDAGSVSTQ